MPSPGQNGGLSQNDEGIGTAAPLTEYTGCNKTFTRSDAMTKHQRLQHGTVSSTARNSSASASRANIALPPSSAPTVPADLPDVDPEEGGDGLQLLPEDSSLDAAGTMDGGDQNAKAGPAARAAKTAPRRRVAKKGQGRSAGRPRNDDKLAEGLGEGEILFVDEGVKRFGMTPNPSSTGDGAGDVSENMDAGANVSIKAELEPLRAAGAYDTSAPSTSKRGQKRKAGVDKPAPPAGPVYSAAFPPPFLPIGPLDNRLEIIATLPRPEDLPSIGDRLGPGTPYAYGDAQDLV